MKIYAFSSTQMANIWAGVGAQRWAVPFSEKSASSNKGRATKSKKLQLGSAGILYSSDLRCFTTPFIVRSLPHPTELIADIWFGKWILWFDIQTLGTPHRRLSWDDAQSLLPSCKAGTPLHKLINVEPLTVFAGNEISESDWSVFIEKLAS